MFGYDNNGNMTSVANISNPAIPTATYAYRPDNMMIRAVTGAGETTYEYDGDQRRVARTADAGTAAAKTTLYSYGPAGQLLGEYRRTEAGVASLRDYIYAGTKLIADVVPPQTTVGFTTSASTVSEGAGSVAVTVTLTIPPGAPPPGDVTVAYTTVNGSATAGQDYVAASGMLTFPTGTTERTITVTLTNDPDDEPDENFSIQLSNVVGAELGTASHVVTLRDNDPHLIAALDLPVPGSVHTGWFAVSGWAIDRDAASGTGVSSVRIHATRVATGVSMELGPASYGGARPTVAATYGAQFLNSGVDALAMPPGAGTFDVFAVAHFTGGTTAASNTVRITIRSSDLLRATDADGDFRSDMTVYNPASGVWSTLTSSSGFSATTTRAWGGAGYLAAPGDYDGDGRMDLGVYRQESQTWSILLSGVNFTTSMSKVAGGPGWIPVPGDYDGDGRTDLALYNGTTGTWQWFTSSTNFQAEGTIGFGGTGWIPVPADYNGDGRTDLGAYRPSDGHWSIVFASATWNETMDKTLGGPDSIPVAADHDGDGKADIAVFRRPTGVWTILKSSTNYSTTFTAAWGGLNHTLVKGDFDGDGRADIASYTPWSGGFYILLSGLNYTTSLTKNVSDLGGFPVPTYMTPLLDAGIAVGPAWPPTGSANACAGFAVRGWAFDVYGVTGTGIDPAEVRLFAKPVAGGSPIALGAATYGSAVPPDVVARLGSLAANAGLTHQISNLPLGSYDVYLSVRMTVTGVTQQSSAVRVTVAGGADFRCAGDFDGDLKTEMVLYQASTATWSWLSSSSGYTTSTSRQWGGLSGYTPVPGDYDGDGRVDLGMYHAATGGWTVLLSGANYTTSLSVAFGGPSWIPVPGDYDGDGKADIALYNTTSGIWSVLKSSTNYSYTGALTVTYGGTGWTAVPGDYDGDGRTDVGVYNGATGLWSVPLSSTNWTTSVSGNLGGTGWTPAAADYDGDRKTDFVAWHSATGQWSGLKSSGAYVTPFSFPIWGGPAHQLVRGDFDGDGKADIATHTPWGSGGFWVILSGQNYTTSLTRIVGGAGYLALPRYQ